MAEVEALAVVVVDSEEVPVVMAEVEALANEVAEVTARDRQAEAMVATVAEVEALATETLALAVETDLIVQMMVKENLETEVAVVEAMARDRQAEAMVATVAEVEALATETLALAVETDLIVQMMVTENLETEVAVAEETAEVMRVLRVAIKREEKIAKNKKLNSEI